MGWSCRTATQRSVCWHDAAEAYLDDIKAHKSSKTLAAYTTAIRYFRESCTKTYVEDINRRDLLAFKTYLAHEKEQSDRSVWNKFSAVMGFLKSVGHTGKIIGVGKHDWPEYDEETPEVYEDDELVKFYTACDEEEARWFRFFEYTGMREGEVQHCQWSWIDMNKRIITVQPDKNGLASEEEQDPLYSDVCAVARFAEGLAQEDSRQHLRLGIPHGGLQRQVGFP